MGAEGGENCIFFYNKNDIFFYVMILTEGIFKNVTNASILEPEGENFEGMRVENQSAGSSELCTAGSLEFFNPPDLVGLKRAKPLLQIHPGISFMENKR